MSGVIIYKRGLMALVSFTVCGMAGFFLSSPRMSLRSVTFID